MFSGRFPCVFADLEGWLTKLLDFYSYERLRHSFKNEFILRKGASNHTNDVQRQRFRKRSEAFFPPWVFSWLQAGGSSVGQTPLDFKDRRATGKLRVNLLGEKHQHAASLMVAQARDGSMSGSARSSFRINIAASSSMESSNRNRRNSNSVQLSSFYSGPSLMQYLWASRAETVAWVRLRAQEA